MQNNGTLDIVYPQIIGINDTTFDMECCRDKIPEKCMVLCTDARSRNKRDAGKDIWNPPHVCKSYTDIIKDQCIIGRNKTEGTLFV